MKKDNMLKSHSTHKRNCGFSFFDIVGIIANIP